MINAARVKTIYIHHTRAHCIMCSSRFFHILQCLVCVQHHQLTGTSKSEALGSGRIMSSEKKPQPVAFYILKGHFKVLVVIYKVDDNRVSKTFCSYF